MLALSWLPWALATPALLAAGRRFASPRPPLTWFALIASYGVMVVASAAWFAWLEHVLNPYYPTHTAQPLALLWREHLYGSLLQAVFLYIAIAGTGYLLAARERLAQQQTEAALLRERLSLEQLNALRRQIEPHFLFNSLHAIAGLVRESRNEDAVNMICGLSDCLRRALESTNRQQVPLSEEMEFLEKYLMIQKYRFADRLQVLLDVPSQFAEARIPSLILQPLVENAIEHGIAKRARGGRVQVSASSQNGILSFIIYNDGPSLPPDWESSPPGIGIANARARLQVLYGDRVAFGMQNRGLDGVEVLLSLPLERM